MIKTKVTKRNNYYVVQLADNLGKYKQVAKFDNELDANVYRKQLTENQTKALKDQATISVREAWKKYSNYKWELYNTHDKLSQHQGAIHYQVSKY